MKTIFSPKTFETQFLNRMLPFLDAMGRDASHVEFEPGEIILREGAIATDLYFIQSGKVALEFHEPAAPDVRVQTIGSGDILGWSWLFAPFRSHFQARALERTEVLVFDGAHLLVLAENDPALGYKLMKQIAQVLIQRLQAVRQQLLEHPELHLPDPAPAPRCAEIAPAPGPAPDVLRSRLADHSFLRGLSAAHQEILAGAAVPARFVPGAIILREGEVANRFYLILDGAVAIESSRPENQRVCIQVVGQDDVLGWSWLFRPYYWHFDARALKPTDAIFFYGPTLREACEQNPVLGCAIMKRVTRILIQRLQAARQQLAGHASMSEPFQEQKKLKLEQTR
jgi:CRP/FNR family cyclic AMP-dependent transcriptional regulator